MKVAFIARSNLFIAPGGDTVQVVNTAEQLKELGVEAQIRLSHETIDYDQYDLLHFFNLSRPADILKHIRKTSRPFVLSPILIDYSEYDKQHRPGLSGFLFRLLPEHTVEYIKTLGRWLLGRERGIALGYIWRGHYKTVQYILRRCTLLLPNSFLEQNELLNKYRVAAPQMIIPNGVDTALFTTTQEVKKDPLLVICAARIEGLKNQLNLIRAFNNTAYKLVLIGSAAPNQPRYYRRCRELAGNNISFVEHIPQQELMEYFKRAQVHILPSWFETCGLSSLEAGMAGCNLVVSNKGFTQEYFEDFAQYCDPSSPRSMFEATEQAARKGYQSALADKITRQYTWQQAARKTYQAYQQAGIKKRQVKIAIMGTRGIPNFYGGFEQFAQHLSQGLADLGYSVLVYNAHDHPHQQKHWKNVSIRHCYNPEKKLGTFGQFVYDFNCIMDVRKQKPDIILMLGYSSSSIWGWLYPRGSTLIYNMDGLEWRRTKYAAPVQQFLRLAEKWAIRSASHHVADSAVIQTYLNEKYGIECDYIPYGATVAQNERVELLSHYGLSPYNYLLLIARIEPENNIDMILAGYAASGSQKKMLVVGDIRNKHGQWLQKKYANIPGIAFIGAIYNNNHLIHTLRTYSYLYLHGHSVGGTNPSLLEAMASRCLIAAHRNPFNQAILGEDAFYFGSAAEVAELIKSSVRGEAEKILIANNMAKINDHYTWNKVISQYHELIGRCLGGGIENKQLATGNKQEALCKK